MRKIMVKHINELNLEKYARTCEQKSDGSASGLSDDYPLNTPANLDAYESDMDELALALWSTIIKVNFFLLNNKLIDIGTSVVGHSVELGGLVFSCQIEDHRNEGEGASNE